MRQADPRTVEEIVLPLAEGMKLCPECSGQGGFTSASDNMDVTECDNCHGTGQVPRFPMLQEPCLDEECLRKGGKIAWTGPPYRPEWDTGLIDHPECQGRGRRLVTTTDALLDAGKPYGIELKWVELGSDGPETWLATAWARKPLRKVFGRSSLLDGETPDPRKALALALEAATAAPGGPPSQSPFQSMPWFTDEDTGEVRVFT